MIDTKRMEAAMRRAKMSKAELAAALGKSYSVVYKKITNRCGIYVSEVFEFARILNLDPKETVQIFFPKEHEGTDCHGLRPRNDKRGEKE